MPAKLKHSSPHKRADLQVSVAKFPGCRSPDIRKRRSSSGVKSKQNCANAQRRHIAITLPSLSILKD